MGVVPTHGSDCRKVRSYPTACPYCGTRVFYFECTCGSKVFLVPGGSGVIHDCRGGPSDGYRSSNLTKDNVVVCNQCGIQVRGDRLLKHMESKCKAGPKPRKLKYRL